MDWTLISLLIISFLGFPHLRHLQLTMGRVRFFSFFRSDVPLGYSWWVVYFSPEVSVNFKWLSKNSWFSLTYVLTACVDLTFKLRICRRFRSSWVRYVFAAFEKINSGFGFSLRSICTACGLGMRSITWIWMNSVSLSNFEQFHEKACWSAAEWKHLTSEVVHLSLLCLWKLHLA